MSRVPLGILGVVLALAGARPARGVVVEVYTSRTAFEARLGGATRIVDFDDVDTSVVDPMAFATDRYAASHGVVITGESGQYASRAFGFPEDYPISSPPNQYAPGPPEDIVGGGNETRLDFLAGSETAAVSGVALVFVDTDLAASSITILDEGGVELRVEPVPVGDGALVFCGLIAVDEVTGAPISVISQVRVVNGTGWPAAAVNDGVPLDDLVFGIPVPLTSATTTTTTTTSTTTTTFDSSTTTTLCAAAPLDRCRKPRGSGRSTLFVRNANADGDDRFVWRWLKGAATRAEEFGDPLSTTAFILCAYDASGLRLGLTAPPGGACRGGACWRRTRGGFVYEDAELTPDGVFALRLREGGDGGTRIVLKGRGRSLRLPPLPFATPVTVQLLQAADRPCWDARFTTARKNSATRFKARSE